jgi:hypothetical protein
MKLKTDNFSLFLEKHPLLRHRIPCIVAIIIVVFAFKVIPYTEQYTWCREILVVIALITSQIYLR